MIKLIILTLIIALGMSDTALAIPPQPNDVDKTIYHFKKYLVQYQEFQKNPAWVKKFESFLFDKVINSNKKTQLIKAACASFEEKSYYKDCISGSMSFYSTSAGLSNVIDYFQKNCRLDPTQADCPLYLRMLNQNLGQLKFILQVH